MPGELRTANADRARLEAELEGAAAASTGMQQQLATAKESAGALVAAEALASAAEARATGLANEVQRLRADVERLHNELEVSTQVGGPAMRNCEAQWSYCCEKRAAPSATEPSRADML